ncbi:MAG: c-type cytochrome, partial [Planctomycetota bacterium]
MTTLLILLTWAFVGTAAQAQSPIDSFNAADVVEGGRLFRIHCARCHGIRGEGGEGADLNRPLLRYAQDDETLYAVISNGIPGTGMPGTFAPGPPDLWRIAAYVRSLGATEAGEPPGDAVRGRELFLAKGGC